MQSVFVGHAESAFPVNSWVWIGACVWPPPRWLHGLQAYCLLCKWKTEKPWLRQKSIPIVDLWQLFFSHFLFRLTGEHVSEAGASLDGRITIITVNINGDPIAGEFKHGFSIFIEAINRECAAKCLLWFKSEQCLLALKCIFGLVEEVEGFAV